MPGFQLQWGNVRFVSPILKRVVYPCLAGAGYFRGTGRRGLAVITYHGVLPEHYKPIDSGFDGSLITAEMFRRQLRLLKATHEIIAPEDLLSWCRNERELPPRAALLTCDDGYLSNLTGMLPVLRDEGLRCLFFVTGASVAEERTMLWHEELLLLFLRARAGSFRICREGVEIAGVLGAREDRRVLWWNAVQRLSQIDAESRGSFLQAAHDHFGVERTLDFYLASYAETQRHFCLMTRTEVQQLDAAGMTIGAHTLSHPVLSQMSPELAWTEITQSRAQLEAALGKPIWAFAYPFGDAGSVTPRVAAMAKQAGFDAAFMNIGGGLGTELPPHAIPRVYVSAGMTLSEFEAHVSGFYQTLQRRVRRSPQPEVVGLTAVSPDLYPSPNQTDSTTLP
ncbi:MAG: polysaccharide deacetylase family protein [Candidatus Sulfotelmatobacter sp.]